LVEPTQGAEAVPVEPSPPVPPPAVHSTLAHFSEVNPDLTPQHTMAPRDFPDGDDSLPAWSRTLSDAHSDGTVHDKGSVDLTSKLVIREKFIQPQVSEEEDNLREAGDYAVIGRLGEGGAGIVHLARQGSVDREVALKMLRDETRYDPETRSKFVSEAVLTGELEHPNIVPIYDLGSTGGGSLFYSMKRVQGTPWSEVLNMKSRDDNLEILLKAADAVAFAHARGVIHRDLKPENIMLGDFGEVLVMDWGIALCTPEFKKFAQINQVTGLGGTPAYMAPEMATGPVESIGPSSDVYLLGGILYEIVTGKPPHGGNSVLRCLKNAAKNVLQGTNKSGRLLEIAIKALQTKPAERYPSVSEFQAALRLYKSQSESIALATRGDSDLEKAEKSGAYEDFARAMFAYQEAVGLWRGNAAARSGAATAKLKYAQTALAKGDYDLGVSLLDEDREEHQETYAKLLAAKKKRLAEVRRLAGVKRVAMLLLIAIFVGAGSAFVYITKAKNEAVQAESLAVQAAEEAKLQKSRAESEAIAAGEARQVALTREKEARDAEERALASAEEANQARQKSEEDQRRAVAALLRAEEASYGSEISLAAEEISVGAFSDSFSLLQHQQHGAQANMRHWEWGRLMFLCQGGQPDSNTVRTLDSHADVRSIDVAASGDRFVSANALGQIAIWDKQENGGWSSDRTLQHGAAVHRVALSKTGRYLVSGGADSIVKIWDLDAAEEPPRELQGHRGDVFSVAFSPERKPTMVASASSDRTIKIWYWLENSEPDTLVGHSAEVYSVNFSADGERVISASEDGTARIWSAFTRNELQRFRGHGEPVYTARFSPDGRWAASGGYDKRILLWRADRTEPVEDTLVSAVQARLDGAKPTLPADTRELIGHTASVRAVAFSADGSLLVSGGEDNTVRLWRGLPVEPTPPALQALTSVSAAPSGDLLKTFRGHGGWVAACALVNDGRQVVSGAYDTTVKVWDTLAYEEVREFAAPGRRISEATFSPDGELILTALDDGTARLWNIASGKQAAVLQEGHEFLTSAGAFLPNGDRLLTAAGDNSVRMWNVTRGVQLWEISDVGRRGTLAISHDGKIFATAESDDKFAQIWDTESGRLIRQLNDGKLQALVQQFPDAPRDRLLEQVPDVTAVAFSPGGETLAVAESEGGCVLWSVDDSETRRVLNSHAGSINAIAFLPQGDTLLTAGADGVVGMWNVRSGERLGGLRHKDAVTALAVSADGTQAITVSSEQEGQVLTLWDLQKHESLQTLSVNQQAEAADTLVNSVVFAPGSKAAVVTVFDKATSRYQVNQWTFADNNYSPLADAKVRFGLVFSAVFNEAASGKMLTVGGTGASYWDLKTGREAINFRPHSLITSAAFSPRGERIATGGVDRSVKIWRRQAATGEWTAEVKLFGEHTAAVRAVQFVPHPNKELLLTASDDHSVILWQLNKENLLWDKVRTFQGHRQAVLALAVAPGGATFATASADSTAKLWNLESGEELATFQGHLGAVNCAAFSDSGDRLLTGGSDNKAILWNVDTAEQVTTLVGHSAAVNSVAFSPDGLRAVSGSQDNKVKLWDTELNESDSSDAAKEVLSLRRHEREVRSVRFSPTGQHILSAGSDGAAILWPAIPVEPAVLLRSPRHEFTTGEPPLRLAPDAYVKSPSQRNFAEWRLKISIVAATSAEQVEFQFAQGGPISLEDGVFRRAETGVAVGELTERDSGNLAVTLTQSTRIVDLEEIVRGVVYTCGQIEEPQQRHIEFTLSSTKHAATSKTLAVVDCRLP